MGEDNDAHTTKITLAIVLTAFIISPMTECLGPVLELNGLLAAIPLAYILPGKSWCKTQRNQCSVWKSSKDSSATRFLKEQIRLKLIVYFTSTGLHQNGNNISDIQQRKAACTWIGCLWNNCNVGWFSVTFTKPHWRLQIEHRARLLQKLWILSSSWISNKQKNTIKLKFWIFYSQRFHLDV